MNEMLLLGAGASVTAGVPGAYDMTKRMLDLFQGNPQFSIHARVLHFVVGGLLFQRSKGGENPLTTGVNVEDLFNAVQLLAQRHTLEASPFVGSWDEMVEELDRPKFASGELDKAIYESVAKRISKALSKLPSSTYASNVDKTFETAFKKSLEAALKGRTTSLFSRERIGYALQEYIHAVSQVWKNELRSSFGIGSSAGAAIERRIEQHKGSGKGRIYYQTNEFMIAALKDLVWIAQDQKLSYLGPILNLLDQQQHLVVASLNYDNAIELLCASQQRACKTGVEGWANDGNFTCEGNGLHLLKMHGSIDWQRIEEEEDPRGLRTAMPVVGIRQVAPDEVSKRDFMPAVIFGQRNKLTADGPFLDLIRAFQSELGKASTLTVVGYSFRDPHVNVYISQWLNRAENNVLQIVNGPNSPESTDYMSLLLDLQRQRPNKVKIIPNFAKEGLEKLYGTYNGVFREGVLNIPSAVEIVASSASQEMEGKVEITAGEQSSQEAETAK